jgi:type IV secretion system protein VirB11
MPMRRSSRQNCRRTGRAGERFEGLLPPVTRAPCFAIRKPASRIHRLTDYVHDGIMDEAMASTLADAVSARSNILVVGGTSSGKTTLANALLAEMANLEERVILIEDTRELQCAAPDTVALRTAPLAGWRGRHYGRSGALHIAPAARPDRGRRDPGRRSPRHAQGLEHRASRRDCHGPRQQRRLGAPPHRTAGSGKRDHRARALIAEAIDLIIFIAGRGHARRVETVLRVNGLRPDGAYDLAALARDTPPEPSPHIDGDLS